MKLLFRLIDPSQGFLLGIDFTDGYAVNELTTEQQDIKMISLGLLLVEISLIWSAD